jgi:syntaxin-binding protein 1
MLGRSPEKQKSVLLILDRAIDCTSPLVHELTYQAMVNDLWQINSDMYK